MSQPAPEDKVAPVTVSGKLVMQPGYKTPSGSEEQRKQVDERQPLEKQALNTANLIVATPKKTDAKLLTGVAVGALILVLSGGAYWYFDYYKVAASTRAADTGVKSDISTPPAVPAQLPVPPKTPVSTPELVTATVAPEPPVPVVPPLATQSPLINSTPASVTPKADSKVVPPPIKPRVEAKLPAKPAPVDSKQHAVDKAKLDQANKTLDDLLK